MSVFGKLFGGGGKGKGPSPQEAIQKLRETEEMLTKKQEFLEKKIEQELQIAKKNGTKNKRGADIVVSIYFNLKLSSYNALNLHVSMLAASASYVNLVHNVYTSIYSMATVK